MAFKLHCSMYQIQVSSTSLLRHFLEGVILGETLSAVCCTKYLLWPDLSTTHQRGSEPSQDRWISFRLHQATHGILEWHSCYALINLSTCKYSAWITAQRETGYKSVLPNYKVPENTQKSTKVPSIHLLWWKS